MTIIRKLLALLAPSGSSRSQIPSLIKELFFTLVDHGFKQAFLSVKYMLQDHWSYFVSYYFKKSKVVTYEEWFATHKADAQTLEEQRKQSPSFPHKPLITVITPIYNPPIDALKEAIESIQEQTYINWEYLLVDGGDDSEIKQLIQDAAAKDSRIKTLFLEENLGISGNINQSLTHVMGEFTFILDHDDVVALNLLYEVVSHLNTSPDTDIIYFDEDKILIDSDAHIHPWFKPKFSPELLLSVNFLMHSVYRTSLVQSVGGFNSEVDGAQDYDLALKCYEHTVAIHHIPKVLYHWRQVAGSASYQADAKPYAFEAQRKSLESHFSRKGIQDVTASFTDLNTIQVNWHNLNSLISIIIPTKDKPDLIKACINSILEKTAYSNYEIIIVDTGTTDPVTLNLYDQWNKLANVKLLSYQKSFNFSDVCNFGAQKAKGDLFLFLNNDTEVIEPDWLSEMGGWAMQKDIGVVGAKLLRRDGTIQHAGVIVGLLGLAGHIFDGTSDESPPFSAFGSQNWYRNYIALTGACLMVRRSVFEQVQGFDTIFDIGFSDVDLCARIHDAGYRNMYTPHAVLIHDEGQSRGTDVQDIPFADFIRSFLLLRDKLKNGDPFFNPNLTSDSIPKFKMGAELNKSQKIANVLFFLKLIQHRVPKSYFGTMQLTTQVEAWPQPLSWQAHLKKTNKSLSFLLLIDSFADSALNNSFLALTKKLIEKDHQVTIIAAEAGSLRDKFLAETAKSVIQPYISDDIRVSIHHVAKEHDFMLTNSILHWRNIYLAKAFGLPTILLADHNQLTALLKHEANNTTLLQRIFQPRAIKKYSGALRHFGTAKSMKVVDAIGLNEAFSFNDNAFGNLPLHECEKVDDLLRLIENVNNNFYSVVSDEII